MADHYTFRLCVLLGAIVVAGVLTGCDNDDVASVRTRSESEQVQSLFQEASQPTGLLFQHYSGATGDFHVPEILGSGVALIDFDGDGDLDVFFVQSNDALYQQGDDSAPLFPLPPGQPAGHRLFANQLVPSGKIAFKDVTDTAGLADQSYGMGVAVADYDNDGDSDIYVTGFGGNTLYRNHTGVFKKVHETGGAQDKRWSTSASFCDVNNDQLPDLYVSNYVHYAPNNPAVCHDSLGQRDYCGPQMFAGVPDALFINTGDGTFVDRSKLWGLDVASSAGLGVVCRDLNQDGSNDVYVANDAMPNLLWLNRQFQRFEEQGQLMGAAINVNGMSEGSMGIAAGDYDHDGDDDLFITHWNNETNTLYRNDLAVGYFDVTNTANLATASLSHTGFGTLWLDIDNDSDLDVFVANGAVQRYVDGRGQLSNNYGQKNQVFLNDGAGRFVDVSSHMEAATSALLTGRGAAFGDIDNDGDTDIVVSNKDAPARLYLNNVGQNNAWLGVKLQGTTSSKDAIGAVVSLTLPSGVTLRRVVTSDGSYLSASDSRVLFGLGDETAPQTVTVSWPSGQTRRFKDLAPGVYHLLIEN